jgi:hypothetical protein
MTLNRAVALAVAADEAAWERAQLAGLARQAATVPVVTIPVDSPCWMPCDTELVVEVIQSMGRLPWVARGPFGSASVRTVEQANRAAQGMADDLAGRGRNVTLQLWGHQ